MSKKSDESSPPPPKDQTTVAQETSMNWRKLLYLGLFLVCAAIVYYQSNQEKEAENQKQDQVAQTKDSSGPKDSVKNGSPSAKSPSSRPPKTKSPSEQPQKKQKKPAPTTKPGRKKTEPSSKPNPAAKFGVKTFQWKSVSNRGAYTSPEGLVYGPGREHRLAHVLDHAVDKPNRPQRHGVFDGGPDKTLALIDQAYAKVKKKSKDVKTEKQGQRTVHVIQMRRRIGFVGGETGREMGHPAAYKVKIVMAGKNVITAFPL